MAATSVPVPLSLDTPFPATAICSSALALGYWCVLLSPIPSKVESVMQASAAHRLLPHNQDERALATGHQRDVSCGQCSASLSSTDSRIWVWRCRILSCLTRGWTHHMALCSPQPPLAFEWASEDSCVLHFNILPFLTASQTGTCSCDLRILYQCRARRADPCLQWPRHDDTRARHWPQKRLSSGTDSDGVSRPRRPWRADWRQDATGRLHRPAL
jgi:hypothetical protein